MAYGQTESTDIGTSVSSVSSATKAALARTGFSLFDNLVRQCRWEGTLLPPLDSLSTCPLCSTVPLFHCPTYPSHLSLSNLL